MVEVFDFEQGTPEWFAARAGIPTASEFENIMKKGRGGKPSEMRKTYMMELAGEVILGESKPGFTSFHTERGNEMEPEARDMYAFITGTEPYPVGFVRNGAKGCSPDSLIGDDGMLEIKSKLPKFAVACIWNDEFPPEHKAQCQGALWVAERDWIDLAVYWPGLPLFVKTAYRDEEYIEQLSDAVDAFNAELAEVVEKVRAYGKAA